MVQVGVGHKNRVYGIVVKKVVAGNGVEAFLLGMHSGV